MITVLFAAASASMPASDAPLAFDDAWNDVDTGVWDDREARLDDPREAAEVQIINGEEGSLGEWPMTGGLILTGTLEIGAGLDTNSFICSSTLIAPDVVLTAAHCLDTAPLELQLGGLELSNIEYYWSRKKDLSAHVLGSQAEMPGNAIRAIATVRHENFEILGMQLGLAENDDIALMFLEEPVLDIPLGYLPQPDTDETRMDIDEEVVIVGWGQRVFTPPGSPPPQGQYAVKYQGVSHIADKAPYEFLVGDSADDTRKCHGDSGGPSFKMVETDSTELYRVVGVTSHTWDFTGCESWGGVDTRVSFHLDWIDEKMREACEDGTRVWCDIPGIIPPPLPDGTVAWEIEEELEEKRACGCSASPSTPWGFGALGLAALALVRRRR
jgi:MYXO-CTERM domain-containing protein